MCIYVCVYICVCVCNHHHQDTKHFHSLRKCPLSLLAISPLPQVPEVKALLPVAPGVLCLPVTTQIQALQLVLLVACTCPASSGGETGESEPTYPVL